MSVKSTDTSATNAKETLVMKFGEKLYCLRKENSMSQEKLAERLGVSRQAISKWEQNFVVPDTDNIVNISKLFQVPVEYLLLDEYDSLDQFSEKKEQTRRNLRTKESVLNKFSPAHFFITGLILIALSICLTSYFQTAALKATGECFTNALEYLKHLPLSLVMCVGIGLIVTGIYKYCSKED